MWSMSVYHQAQYSGTQYVTLSGGSPQPARRGDENGSRCGDLDGKLVRRRRGIQGQIHLSD